MIRIGLTGGIGSGKSTVAGVWARMGAEVIDADSLAKRIMVEDPQVRRQIVEAFGSMAYRPDGSLNRPHLAAQAFAGGRVGELNAIVHPAVRRHTQMRFEQAEREGRPACVKEAALLLEHGRPEELDIVVVVTAPLGDRIRRAAARDGSTPEEIERRADAQLPQERMAEMADHVIRNEGDLGELTEAAEALAKRLFAAN